MSGLFEAEVLAALFAVTSHTTATANALTEALNALKHTDRDDIARQVEKVVELNRLVSARLAGVVRSLGEGGER